MEGSPLLRKRSTLPGCVPGSIFNFAFPSMVGTSTVAPKAACGTLNSRLYNRSFSSRINSGCGSSSIRINKSPLIPPCRAALPLPFMESCMPSATPAGILIVIISSSRTTPSPLHSVHFLTTILPSPPQVGQVVCVCICPRIVLAIRVTTPLPLHVSHVFTPSEPSAPLP